jgi:hypothetical protein
MESFEPVLDSLPLWAVSLVASTLAALFLLLAGRLIVGRSCC